MASVVTAAAITHILTQQWTMDLEQLWTTLSLAKSSLTALDLQKPLSSPIKPAPDSNACSFVSYNELLFIVESRSPNKEPQWACAQIPKKPVWPLYFPLYNVFSIVAVSPKMDSLYGHSSR